MKEIKEAGYIESSSAYSESRFSNVFGSYNKHFWGLIIITTLVLFVLFWLQSHCLHIRQFWLLLAGIFSIAYACVLVHQVKQKFYSKFKDLINRDFLLKHQEYWQSYRSILFFKFLYDKTKKKVSEETLELIEQQIKMNEDSVFNKPVFIGAFSALSILFHKFLDTSNFSSSVLFIFILGVVSLICYICIFMDIFKTKNQKLQELKLFILWYNDFGYNLFNDSASKIMIDDTYDNSDSK